MINFVYPDKMYMYHKTLDLFTQYMRGSKSNKSKPGMINLHFFLEPYIIKEVGLEGKNAFLQHGLADKNYMKPEYVDVFDLIIVPGCYHNRKLLNAGISPFKVAIGGYPKMDHLFKRPKTYEKIAWMPSHNIYVAGAQLSSYPTLDEYLEQDIIRSVHPANKESHEPTDDLLLKASVVIGDFGSTIYEAWALNTPVVFPDWLIKESLSKYYPGSLEHKIYEDNIGTHVDDIYKLKYAIRHRRPISPNEIALINDVFPVYLRGNSGEHICNLLERNYV